MYLISHISHLISRSLSPQGTEHGDDLLFPAHNVGQKDTAVFRFLVEGLADDLLITYKQQLGTL